MTFKDVLILLPCQSLENLSLDQSDENAEELLTAWSAPFHPAIVATAERTHRWMAAANPPDANTLENALVFLPKTSESLLPEKWLAEAEAAGVIVIRNLDDRDRVVSKVLAMLETPPPSIDPEIIADFFAVGFCQFIVELLTRKLRYMSGLDEEQFQRNVVAAAEYAIKGDADTTHDKLQSAFDQLSHAREYFYPSEASFIDLTLVAASTLGTDLAQELRRSAAVNLLISGADLQIMQKCEPETFEMLKKSLEEDKAALAGGEENSHPTALMLPEAVLADLQRGLETHERLLGRKPKVFGRRRFGLSPLFPQMLANLGFQGALHLSLDAGRFPTARKSRVLWEGPSASSVEALTRQPLDAARPQTFLALPEKIGDAMDLDHNSTVVFAHWPGRACRWYEDLQRIVRYSSALGRFDDLNHYFESSYGAGYTGRYGADDYRSPYLQQATAAGRPDPVSRWTRYYRRRTAAEALGGISFLAAMISPRKETNGDSHASLLREIDDSLESGNFADDSLDRRIAELTSQAIAAFSRALPREKSPPRPGRLTINPWSFSAATAQQTIPAMGYSWLEPREGTATDVPHMPQSPERSQLAKLKFWQKNKKKIEPPLAEENFLRNEFFEITFDPATGAIRAIHDYHSRNNRLAQQLAFRLPAAKFSSAAADAEDESAYSIMAADEFRVARADKHVGEMFCRGRLVDREAGTLADFTQTTRVRRGSRVIELELEIQPHKMPRGNPWNCYYASRFAWHDSTAEVFRDVNSTTHPTEAELLESPRFLDIRSEKSRTTILSGGLPFHRRFGLRKLDTILIVAGEQTRRFRLGIGIDLARPAAAANEFLCPLPAIAETAAPPASRAGWFFHVDAKNVVATAWDVLEVEGRQVGFLARFLETEGRNACFHLRCLQGVAKAETTDFRGEDRNELAVDGDQITIDIAAHEWLQIEARWKGDDENAGADAETVPDYFMDKPC